MAEPTVQQLARQRIAKVDIAQFAPKPPKKSGPVPKQIAPKPPKKHRVILTPEERKAKARQYNHEWYVAHKEHCLAQSKKWRQEHKEEYNARMREYRRKQSEKRSDGTRI